MRPRHLWPLVFLMAVIGLLLAMAIRNHRDAERLRQRFKEIGIDGLKDL